MKKEWNTIDVLRHVRHDWMNKLQLIKGNLDLNKIDRTKEVIADIIMESQNETKLTNLNLPSLTLLIFTHKWESEFFQLEFEVMDDRTCKSLDEDYLTSWVEMFFSSLNGSVKKYADNRLVLTIEPKEKGLCFFFDFCGIIEKREIMDGFLQRPNQKIKVNEFNVMENEFSLDVFVPYNV